MKLFILTEVVAALFCAVVGMLLFIDAVERSFDPPKPKLLEGTKCVYTRSGWRVLPE